MIRKTASVVLGVLILAGCLTGCASRGKRDIIDPQKKSSGKRSVFAVSKDVEYDTGDVQSKYLNFVFESTGKFCSDYDGNIVISPASLFIALEMTAGGADGETLRQFTDVLVPGASDEEAFRFAADYYRDLAETEDIKLDVIDMICLNEDFSRSVYEDYYDFVKGKFDSEIFAGIRPDEIDAMINEKTDGMIPEISSSIDPAADMTVINAIVFKAGWKDEYCNKEIENDRVFTQNNGAEQKVTLLKSLEDGYFKAAGAKGFMKYYSGGRYAFLAILPDDDSIKINDFMVSFTYEDYLSFLRSFDESYEVEAYIPEFTVEYSNDNVSAILEDMGITDAFDPGKADFSNMTGKDLYLGNIIHKTTITVDREGTEATSVTMIPGSTMGGDFHPRVEVRLDRPFAYMIIDTETDIPVFIGTVNNVE